MKTVEHKLLSIPGKKVRLPEEAVKKTNTLLNNLKEFESVYDMRRILSECDYLENVLIDNAVIRVFDSKSKPESAEYKKAIDKLYMHIGREELNKDNTLQLEKLYRKYEEQKMKVGSKNNILFGELGQVIDIVDIGSEVEFERLLIEGLK
jgi:hypothetical protein